jgi:16S rRNA (cytosine1402-N4)-methyltransferase
MLPAGGRLAAISFHSLEDRPVKRFLAERAKGCVCPPELPVCACGRRPEADLLTRRAVSPGPEEIAANARARSAHLRAAVKIGEPA